MFAKFELDLEMIDRLKSCFDVDFFDTERERGMMYRQLEMRIKGDDKGIINGKELQNSMFPVESSNTYDVFISYSHDDVEYATYLAAFLTQKCKLRVFLDTYVWGNADALLKNIDDEYCKNSHRETYNYTKRNYSTSHVHAMLSMAIFEMINNTECCIFIKSNNSTIDLNVLRDNKNIQTLSPWIYEENKMMQLLPSRGKHRQVRYFSEMNQRKISDTLEKLKISYELDFDNFLPLTYIDLLNLATYNGVAGLDALYEKKSQKHFLCD